MFSMIANPKFRLKYMIFKRIADDFDCDFPSSVNMARMEEAAGADIEYLYGKVGQKIYRMMLAVYDVIDASRDPFNDPEVESVLEKYEYYISPTGLHIYGAGPKFNEV